MENEEHDQSTSPNHRVHVKSITASTLFLHASHHLGGRNGLVAHVDLAELLHEEDDRDVEVLMRAVRAPDFDVPDT